MKLCKDCNFSRKGWFEHEYRCVAPENSELDPVEGGSRPKNASCISQRIGKLDGYCGEAGRWFKPKATG